MHFEGPHIRQILKTRDKGTRIFLLPDSNKIRDGVENYWDRIHWDIEPHRSPPVVKFWSNEDLFKIVEDHNLLDLKLYPLTTIDVERQIKDVSSLKLNQRTNKQMPLF